MKHLFVVHSGITALVASMTIGHLGLDAAEVTILTGRGMNSDFGYRGLEIHDLGRLWYGRNVIRFRRQLAAFDRAVEELVGRQEFAAYLPGLYTEQMYALASHRLCRTTALLEEGSGSYTAKTRQYSRRTTGHALAARMAGWGRFPPHESDQSARLHAAYCLSAEAFPDWPAERKHVLDFAIPAGALQACPFDVVFTGETIPERGRASLDEYERVMAEAASALRARGFSKFGIKFHPNNDEAVRERLTARLSVGTGNLTVIPPGEWLEKWMGPSGPLFVGATSSVLHYAVLTGGRAVSVCDLFRGELMPAYFDKMIPGSTRNRIERLGVANNVTERSSS